MADDPKRIDIAEFRELGFLQEANRQFFHPLGLALEVVVEDCDGCEGDGKGLGDRGTCTTCGGDGKTERLGGVWDYREDAEGIYYAGELEIDPKKVGRVHAERMRHLKPRQQLFQVKDGVQPLPEEAS